MTFPSFAAAVCSLVLFVPLVHAADASVRFVEPKDGSVVRSPFVVKFAVNGMEIRPAGDMTSGTGHHHLLINHGSMPAGAPIPMDDTHLHYGKGQTEAQITLAPGKYVLTMQFTNGAHQSYGATMSQTIHVTVQ